MLATHAVIIVSVRIFTNRVIIDSNPEPSLSIVIQATMAQSPPSKHNLILLILLILLSGILTACQALSIHQQPVQPNQQYTVGLQGYHASNAKPNLDVTMDELTELGRGRVVATCVQDLVLEYFREHQNFREEIEGRLVYLP